MWESFYGSTEAETLRRVEYLVMCVGLLIRDTGVLLRQ
jgi:hypothetical protein